jgi:hypothetical protein
MVLQLEGDLASGLDELQNMNTKHASQAQLQMLLGQKDLK